MAIGQGAAETAKGFFTAMADQPVMMALCVVIFALIGFIYYEAASNNAQRESNVKLIVQAQSEAQKLLAQCIVPPSGGTR